MRRRGREPGAGSGKMRRSPFAGSTRPIWLVPNSAIQIAPSGGGPATMPYGRASGVATGKSFASPDCGSSQPYRRSEEHTSELQSRFDIVCRLLLEKKKNIYLLFLLKKKKKYKYTI